MRTRGSRKGIFGEKVAVEQASPPALQFRPIHSFSSSFPHSFVHLSLKDRRPPTGPSVASLHRYRIQKCNTYGRMTEAFL